MTALHRSAGSVPEVSPVGLSQDLAEDQNPLDAQPDPEPASPSLPAPDPGIYTDDEARESVAQSREATPL